MAVSPVIPNCIQVRLLWNLQGNGAINVLHGLAGGSTVVGQALANTLGVGIKAAFTANLSGQMPASSVLVRVGVRDLRVANGFEFLDSGAPAPGVAIGDAMPAQVAAVATLRTGKAGKSFRGRVYLSGWVEATNIAGGTADPSVGDNVVAFLTGVDSTMGTAGLPLAVASRPAERYTVVRTTFHNDGTSSSKTITQGPARAGGVEDVTLIQSRNNQWETQRRRVNGRGSLPT